LVATNMLAPLLRIAVARNQPQLVRFFLGRDMGLVWTPELMHLAMQSRADLVLCDVVFRNCTFVDTPITPFFPFLGPYSPLLVG